MTKQLITIAVLFMITSALEAYCIKEPGYYGAYWKNSSNGKKDPLTESKIKKLSKKLLVRNYKKYGEASRNSVRESRNNYSTSFRDGCVKEVNQKFKLLAQEMLRRNWSKYDLKTGFYNFGISYSSLKNKENQKIAYVKDKLYLSVSLKAKKDGAKIDSVDISDIVEVIKFDIKHPEYKSEMSKILFKYKPLKLFSNEDINTLIEDVNGYSYNVAFRDYSTDNLKGILKLLEKNKINIDSTELIDKIINKKYSSGANYSGSDQAKNEIVINKRKAKIIKLLVKYLPDVNFLTKKETTILIWAAKHNKYNLVKLLIEKGADIRLTDDAGYTALSYAENNNNKNMIKLIKGGTSGKQTGIDKMLAKKSARPDYNSFALIIGINDYMNETNVDYADNSAKSFKLLAHNVLGVPKENIIMLTNEKATSGQIKSNVELISQLVEDGSTLYFYYAGHGVPATNGKTYLLPSDMKADNIEIEKQLAISNIYDKFSKSPAKKVVVFMDSCFSGKDDSGELLYKGVAPVLRNKKATVDTRKLAVFSAGSSLDFANQYKDEEQRMFSYFVMKGLLEGKKNSDELSNYVKMSVKRKSLRLGLSYKQVPQYDGKTSLKIVQ